MISRDVFARLARRHNTLALSNGGSALFVFTRIDTKATIELSGIFTEDNQAAFGIQGGMQDEDRSAQVVFDETTLLEFLSDRVPSPEVWETDKVTESNQTEWTVKSSLSDRNGLITLFLRKQVVRSRYAPDVRG